MAAEKRWYTCIKSKLNSKFEEALLFKSQRQALPFIYIVANPDHQVWVAQVFEQYFWIPRIRISPYNLTTLFFSTNLPLGRVTLPRIILLDLSADTETRIFGGSYTPECSFYVNPLGIGLPETFGLPAGAFV